jgi:hypothetical protein
MTRTQFRYFFLTLRGHLVVIGGPIAIVSTIFFCFDAYSRHELSLRLALRLFVSFAFAGIITGIFGWYCVMRPAVKRNAKQ